MSNPMISEQCKTCGAEDCVCCEIWVDSQREQEPETDFDHDFYDNYDVFYDEEEY